MLTTSTLQVISRRSNKLNFKPLPLKQLGATSELAAQLTSSLSLGRVISVNRTLLTVAADEKIAQATLAGRLLNTAFEAEDYPTVGDWVGIREVADTAVVERLLPRQSLLMRKAAGRTSSAQLIAANVDVLLICMALDQNFNLRRLERYLSLAHASGAQATVVLTKADQASDLENQLLTVSAIAGSSPVIVCNAVATDGLQSLEKLLKPRLTYALIGSSGVGKSTLINRLLGNGTLATQAVRQSDAHGRHTTTGRDLFQLPTGSLVIDTPGMRELGLLDADVAATFQDILALAVDCKFHNCTHTHEPGCAVQAAVNNGQLDAQRLRNYQQLTDEQAQNADLRGRAREAAKINRMFGSKKAMKAAMQQARRKRH